MRKTLLIAAATLAAGVIAAQADAVYSQNIVGYYNVTIPGLSGSTGFYIVANQFNVGSSNGLNEMFASGGLASDVNGTTNSTVYIWRPDAQVYATYQYFNAADAAADASGGTYANGAGFYDGSGNYATPIIAPGSSVFIQNLAAGSLTVPIVGSIPQVGTNLISMKGSAAGALNLVSAPIPVSTNICSSPINFVGTSDANGTYNDVVYLWNPTNGVFSTYQYFNAADAAADASGGTYANGAGFYDGSGNSAVVAPVVGTGFFIQHFGANGDGSTETWTNIFTVQ
jgi:hypothetical protein